MLTLRDILLARECIGGRVRRTPLQHELNLGHRLGCNLYLKLENHQYTGSFKVRGALNRVAALSVEERRRGIVTASSGNHALGVAYAARAFGDVPATLFLPRQAPRAKIERLTEFGADVRLEGDSYDAAHHAAERFRQAEGRVYVHAYDDPLVIAGQGTIGLEIMEDLPDVEAVLVPVGGGGLSAGVAAAVKAVNPRVRVIGVQPDATPAAYLSFRDGCAYEEYEAAPTIADGLAGGYGKVAYDVARHVIDEIVVVPEADVRRAVAWLLGFAQELVEGAAAAAIAPLLGGGLGLGGRKVVAIMSGRNIDAALVCRILAEFSEELSPAIRP